MARFQCYYLLLFRPSEAARNRQAVASYLLHALGSNKKKLCKVFCVIYFYFFFCSQVDADRNNTCSPVESVDALTSTQPTPFWTAFVRLENHLIIREMHLTRKSLIKIYQFFPINVSRSILELVVNWNCRVKMELKQNESQNFAQNFANNNNNDNDKMMKNIFWSSLRIQLVLSFNWNHFIWTLGGTWYTFEYKIINRHSIVGAETRDVEMCQFSSADIKWTMWAASAPDNAHKNVDCKNPKIMECDTSTKTADHKSTDQISLV